MKNSFVIQGLAGKKELTGEIQVGGAKNAVLKMLAASLLFEDTVTLSNVPGISDVEKMNNLLTDLGATIEKNGEQLSITTADCHTTIVNTTIAQSMRASVVLIGPMLGRFGKVTFPHPGGDVIGARPIDLFINAFEKMGATIAHNEDVYEITTINGLHGADIFLDIRSVGVTETVMLGAVLAEGTTVIRNAATEPEIEDVAKYLVSCGAKITGAGTSTIEIEGGSLLKANGKVYDTIPDRIETGSFMILGALASKKLTITNCRAENVRALISLFEKAGVSMDVKEDNITIYGGDTYKAVNVRTDTYPGFATDLQAPMTVFLTQAEGESTVFETLFEGRLHYTDDLAKMGADITMYDPHRVMIRGPKSLVGRELEGPDIRAGLAFVFAAILAEGESVINNIDHIDRGYENIEERLTSIGVTIKRV